MRRMHNFVFCAFSDKWQEIFTSSDWSDMGVVFGEYLWQWRRKKRDYEILHSNKYLCLISSEFIGIAIVMNKEEILCCSFQVQGAVITFSHQQIFCGKRNRWKGCVTDWLPRFCSTCYKHATSRCNYKNSITFLVIKKQPLSDKTDPDISSLCTHSLKIYLHYKQQRYGENARVCLKIHNTKFFLRTHFLSSPLPFYQSCITIFHFILSMLSNFAFKERTAKGLAEVIKNLCQ